MDCLAKDLGWKCQKWQMTMSCHICGRYADWTNDEYAWKRMSYPYKSNYKITYYLELEVGTHFYTYLNKLYNIFVSIKLFLLFFSFGFLISSFYFWIMYYFINNIIYKQTRPTWFCHNNIHIHKYSKFQFLIISAQLGIPFISQTQIHKVL